MAAPADPPAIAEVEDLLRVGSEIEAKLAALAPGLKAIDQTLSGALETAGRKVAHQIEQLSLRIRKAAERNDETTSNRLKKLETMLLPGGVVAERLYPPLVPMLAYGRDALTAIREAAVGSLEGAPIVAMGADRPAKAEEEAHVR